MNAPEAKKEPTVDVQYVGSKPMRQDTVAGTGIVWMGNGDVQPVPERAVARLLQHPDVWALKGSAGKRVNTLVAAAFAPKPPRPADPADAALPPGALKGTNHEPELMIAPDKTISLADLVQRAAAKMGSAEAWNAMDDGDRHELVDAELEEMRDAARAEAKAKAEAEAADKDKPKAPAKKPAAKKAPAKKAAAKTAKAK